MLVPSKATEGRTFLTKCSNQDNQYLDLVPLQIVDSDWSLAIDSSIRLPGGHGSEIVRSFCFDHPVNKPNTPLLYLIENRGFADELFFFSIRLKASSQPAKTGSLGLGAYPQQMEMTQIIK